MIIECEGIVIRQTPILKHRSMILLLTDQLGKVSAGTSIALKPFSRGSYELKKTSEFISITSAEIDKAYYSLSDDYDKLVNASLTLEITGKVLLEDAPAREIFVLLCEYLDLMETRKSAYSTLTNAYLVKLLAYSGVLPEAVDFTSDELLSKIKSDIVNVILFMRNEPLKGLAKLKFDTAKSVRLLKTLIGYTELHLDIGKLKSGIPGE
jgi:hypothetical protein